MQEPYNPLDKRHLGESVARALLEQAISPLPPPEPFEGAGIYVVYYTGTFPPYEQIAALNREGRYQMPIYVGKAVPAGARKGGVRLGIAPGRVLYQRIREHARDIQQATNLSRSEFACRYLTVDDIWIPLGESLLIEWFLPLWNRVIDGFGNHDPGGNRYRQEKSAWDVLHPGRPWAAKCGPHRRSRNDLLKMAKDFIAQHLSRQ